MEMFFLKKHSGKHTATDLVLLDQCVLFSPLVLAAWPTQKVRPLDSRVFADTKLILKIWFIKRGKKDDCHKGLASQAKDELFLSNRKCQTLIRMDITRLDLY